MKKSHIATLPKFFDKYINLVPDMELSEALDKYVDASRFVPLEQLERLKDYSYAAGKWTVADTLQHITDVERVMSYRALRLARHDETPLPGFDEELFARHTNARARTIADLLEESIIVRKSTMMLFNNFSNEMLVRSGICSNQTISVLALGFVIAGHGLHHMNILKERYLSSPSRHPA